MRTPINRRGRHLWTWHPYSVPVVFGALALTAASARAQDCLVHETARVLAPMPATAGNSFGSAAIVDGDRALVAAINNDEFGTNAGTVYALRKVSGVWSVTQTIGSPDASATDQFGFSLAISGDWALIGAPQEDPSAVSNNGAAYAYHWDGAQWVYHSHLTPTDPSAGKQFARSVAVDGDVAACSAVGDIQGGNSAAGAAYVFRYNGTAWVQERKLMEQSPAPLRRFGNTVAVQEDMVLVTALPSGTNPANTEGVYMFEYDGVDWIQTQRIQSPIWPGYEEFGATLRLEGDTLAATASPNVPPGKVRVFRFDGKQWNHEQEILGPPATFDGSFGIAIDLQGDRLLIGAPTRQAPTYPPDSASFNGGLAYLYERSGTTWTLDFTLRAKPRWNFVEFNWDNQFDQFSASVALSDDDMLIGATCADATFNPGEFGYVAVIPILQPDCDGNGVPDICDPDCDHNDSVDACDIAQNPDDDCDDNGALDACEESPEYALDGGLGSFIAVAATGTTLDYLWLNQFRVQAGGQRITHIALPWTLYTPDGSPLTLLVYDDPNDDGDPSDAVLLSATAAVSAESDNGISAFPLFVLYKIPTTFVGDIGESFFVGAHMPIDDHTGAAMIQSGNAAPGRCWRASGPQGSIDYNIPAGLAVYANRYVLRAMGLDCNGNGVNDDCDIAGGFSLDLNSNGVPDECDDHCPADITGTGNVVDVNDLLAIITTWGPCANCPPMHCTGDIAPVGPPQGNCVIDVNDLLAVITSWGACL